MPPRIRCQIKIVDMDARTQRILQIGHATRFERGNPGGPGRPRTRTFASCINRLGKQFCPEPTSLWTSSRWEQFTLVCIMEALNGSAEHAQMLARHAGSDLWKETRQVLKDLIENPESDWLLRRKPPRSRRKVPGLRITAEKAAGGSLSTAQDNDRTAPPEMAVEQAPAPVKRGIRVALW